MNKNITEVWEIIFGYSNYEISSFGRIRKKNGTKLLHPSNNGNGYLRICLYDDFGIRKYLYVHRLVLITFKGKPDDPNMVTNHIDEDKQNNHIDNLEWMTLVENFQYGTSRIRAADSRCKPILQVETGRIFKSALDVEYSLGYKQANINACCLGKQETCGGFHWMYANENEARKHTPKENACKTAVRCIETQELFESIVKAGQKYGLNKKNISLCCSGKRHTCGGYHWERVR